MELTEEEKKALQDELIEKTKTELAREAKADIEKVNKLIADERKKFEDQLKGRITEAELKAYEEKSRAEEKKWQDRIDAIETKMARLPIESPDTKAEKPGAKEYKSAFFNFIRTGVMKLEEKAQAYITEFKALVSDTTGQILIPEELETEIYRALPTLNVMRSYAIIRPTVRDRIRRRSLTEVDMGWGKLELGKEPVETDVVPGEEWQYVEDLEGLARIGKDELADSDVAIEATITDSFSRARARNEEKAFVLGTGHANQQPEGILNGATVTRVLAGQIDAVKVDDFLNLIYAVPKQYRRDNAVLFVPSTTELAMRKLKSATEELYLWQPSVQAGKPATFAGYPVENQEDIPAIASATSCDIAIFGSLRAGYRIIDRQGMTMQRLLELFATSGLIGLLASARVGGGVIRPDALRILREPAA